MSSEAVTFDSLVPGCTLLDTPVSSDTTSIREKKIN